MAGNWNRIGNISGRDGKGVPEGGVRDDVLVKVGGSDFATGWSKLDYSQIEGKVPAEALPQISVEPYVVDSQAKMLNLPAVPGRMAIRTDVGKTFVLAESPASTLANWVELKTSSDVTSVNSKVGAVVLTKADVGLSNVDNTSDADKPLATSSVRGLMAPGDKSKLDGATPNNTGNALVRRDANSKASFRSIQVIETVGYSDAARKDYVDAEVAKRVPFMGGIPDGSLDTIITPGVYTRVSSTVITNPANNYPAGSAGAGVLVVTTYSTLGIIQEWTTWAVNATSGNRRWLRNSNDGGETWTGWRELAGKEPATASSDGLMPSADKSKLDGATPNNTGNALVRRDANGRAAFRSTQLAETVDDSHATRKDYVDAELARRGSSTTTLTTGPDLNTLTSPGVFNVGRETLNTPVIAGIFSSCRVEVDVLHGSLASNRPTVFQTARMNAENRFLKGSWATTFSDVNRQALVASQTYRRESYDGGLTWSDWRAEGTTPWFPMDNMTSAAWGDSDAFYGIATGTAYPGVVSASTGTAVWRICNGMIETPLQVQSPVRTGQELKVADVCTGLRPLGSIGVYRVSAETNQYHGIVGAMAVYVPGENRISISVRGPNDNSSSVPYAFSGLTWPVPVTSYTI